jgi:hypothetical protein
MALTLEKARELIRSEYSNLCKALSLQQVDTDIYIVQPNSKQTTQFGTSLMNDTPQYGPGLLILPLMRADLEACPEQSPAFPPTVWNKHHLYEWPVWRIELWHEVCHQVEDQVFHKLNSQNKHGETWRKAKSFLAKSFGVESEDLARIL